MSGPTLFFLMLGYTLMTTQCGIDQPHPFRTEQCRYSRVRQAYQEKLAGVRLMLARHDLKLEQLSLYLQAFKRERLLRVWTQHDNTLIHLVDYRFAGYSGTLGPKRRQGDGQIPEGFYELVHFNPVSNFHLSMKIDYPNGIDRRRAGRDDPGGDIFIHGNRVTIGCIPITDDKIKELYVLAVESYCNTGKHAAVHIFPAALDDATFAGLAEEFGDKPDLIGFWRTLKKGYDIIVREQRLPRTDRTSGEDYTIE